MITVLDLAWQTIKARKGGFVGAFIAILCGTALVAGCGILMESGLRAGVPAQRYAGAAAVVGGDQSVHAPGGDALEFQPVSEQPSIPADLVGKIAAVPGVRAAVPDVSFPAQVVGVPGASLGHNWDSTVLAPYALRAGRAPAAPDEVALDADLARHAGVSVGQRVQVMTRSVPVSYVVSGIVALPQTPRQAAMFFTAARAAELAGRPGRVTAIGVLSSPDITSDALAGRLTASLAGDHVSVATGVERSAVEFTDVGQTRTLLFLLAGSFGGYALMVAILVVASTLALAVEQRRREFALLRAIAATPRQIRKLIGVETTVVATIAGVLGSGLGVAVAYGMRDAFAGIGFVPADFELAVGPIPLVAAFLTGLGAARLAAWTASRRPSSINPVEALGEAAVQPRRLGRARTIIGWVLVAIGTGAATVPLFVHGQAAMAVSASSVLVDLTGLALLGPIVVAKAVGLVAPVLRRISRVGGYLAAANTSANTRRLAAAVTPLMLAVSFAVVIFYSEVISTTAAQQQTAQTTTADYTITGAGGVSPDVAVAARSVPGVTAATSVVRTEIMVAYREDKSFRIERVPAEGLDQAKGVLDLGVATGRIEDLTGDAVALSRAEADYLGKKLGDTVDFTYGDGTPAHARLVATFTHDLAFGDYVLPAAAVRAHTTSMMDSAVLVRGPQAGEALQALAQRYPGLTVIGGSVTSAPLDGNQQFMLNLVAVGVILGYVAISVANTLVMSTAQRGREFALLRLIGSTRRQVGRMMRVEALLTVGIAIVLGSLIPVLPLALLGVGLIGNPIMPSPLTVYFGIIAGAAALGIVSLAVSTRIGLRARPIDAIGLRE